MKVEAGCTVQAEWLADRKAESLPKLFSVTACQIGIYFFSFWLERDKTVAIQSVISIDERHFFWWSHGLVVSLEHTM